LAFSAVLTFLCFFTTINSETMDEFRVNPAARLWKASTNKRPFQPRMLGSQPITMVASNVSLPLAIGEAASDNLPKTFDARKKWSYCKDSINTVRNQAQCESCWAVTSAAAISDLTCIQCKGKVSPYLSDEDLITCCEDCSSTHNCVSGGNTGTAFQYWVQNGLVSGGSYGTTDSCSPYTVNPYAYYRPNEFPAMPICDNSCVNSRYAGSYKADKHRGKEFGAVHGEEQMKLALYKYGPLVASFQVYDDFQRDYDHGIYHVTPTATFQGWHAVKVIGWGEENGHKYWLVVNSWGTNWGMAGLFKILRGTNECYFESNVVWGVASPNSCFSKQTTKSTTTSTSTRTTTRTPTTSSSTSTKTSTRTTTRAPTVQTTKTSISSSTQNLGGHSAGNMSQVQFSVFTISSILIFIWNAFL